MHHPRTAGEAKRMVAVLDLGSRETAELLLEELGQEHDMAERVTRCFVVDTLRAHRQRAGGVTLDAPLYLMWKITKGCNLRCQHCWADLQGRERTTDELLGAVDRFAELGVVSLSLSGGEPFVRKDIFEIIEAVKRRRIILEVMTNGTLLDEARLDRLAGLLSRRDDVVQVSLDGADDEILRRQRSRPILHRVLATLEGLKARGLKVRVTFTATPYNLASMVDTYALVNELGVDVFSVAPVFPLRRGEALDDGLDEELYLRGLLACKLLDSHFDTRLRWFLTRKLVPQLIRRSGRYDQLGLPAAADLLIELEETQISAVIDSAGELYPAAELSVEALSAGNIYQQDLGDLWRRGRNWRELRKGRDLRASKCSYCRAFSLCRGGSKARAYLEYGTIHAPDPTCSFLPEEIRHAHTDTTGGRASDPA